MTGGRATTIEGFRHAMAGLGSADGRSRGLAFVPRPDDVIISPYGKCGTTWLQQIVHTLRTGGDTDHSDISAVVPWIEQAHDLGLDLDAEQRGWPRAFKSHTAWNEVPRGARYIVSLRRPLDAMRSLYRFMEGWFFEPGSIELADFAVHHYLAREPDRDFWHHLDSWWRVRERDDVLVLAYEHMLAAPRAHIERIAAFVGIEPDDALLAVTLEHSSREFMLAHRHLFDDRLMRERSERLGGLPPGSRSDKVRGAGEAARDAALPAHVLEAFARRWRERITPAHGFEDYEALLVAMDGRG